MPDTLIETGGNFILPTCTSVFGAEGRCLSTCVPQLADTADSLPQDICDENERCTPCFDPLQDGAPPTGACELSCVFDSRVSDGVGIRYCFGSFRSKLSEEIGCFISRLANV